MFKVIKQSDKILETILATESLTARTEETQTTNTDQDEVVAMLYEMVTELSERIEVLEKKVSNNE
jgi:hypothetical protein